MPYKKAPDFREDVTDPSSFREGFMGPSGIGQHLDMGWVV